MPAPRISLSRLAPFALILALFACDEPAPSGPPPGVVPAELRVLGGDGQMAAVGAALPEELVVTAVDAAGRPIPGVQVQFVVVAGGGQVAPQAVTADERGFARTRWTLGTVAADSQVVEARVEGVPARRLRALVRPDVPAAFTVSGGGAVGQVGAALADSLSVTVKDRYGNPVEGVEVAWEVAAGGGAVSPARSFTRADGTSKAQWTLGLRVDSAQSARVRVGSLDPVAFTANAVTAGVPLQLAKRGGDGQRGPAGGVLADSLGVVLRMQDGRPVQGALVNWSVPEGAGVVTPAVSRTDANGAASALWRLGTGAGLVQATATVDEGTLTFTALTESEAPAEVALVSGDGGTGPVGGALADSLGVRVRDRYGNLVPGAEVVWEVVDGGGSFQPARSLTDAAGIARAQWVLGPRVDAPQTAQARVAGLAPIPFSATATTRGVALQLAKRGGDGQRGPAGAVLADSLGVVLRMPDGRPVQGALVTWSVPPDAGTVTPASARTDAEGLAFASWRLGTRAGLAQATASVDAGTLVFTSLTESAAPAQIVAAGGGGEGPVGGAMADSLAVRVTDAYGNPVPGAEIAWAVASGGGAVQPARSLTDAAGIARSQWVLGPRVDAPQTAQARVAGLAPIPFSATATTRGVPLQLAKRGGDGQRGPAGAVLADSLGVVLRLPDGRPVQGALVTWSVPAEAGTVAPGTSRTDAEGLAFASWQLGTRAGLAQATASVDEGMLIFTSLTEAAAPAQIVAAGGGGEGPVGGAMADSLSVRVTDAYGNAVQGAQVSWAAAAGSGGVQPAVSTTDAQGVARARWTLGPLVGTPGQTVSATVAGLPPATFAATATTRGVPLQFSFFRGHDQRGPVGQALPESLTVQLRTQSGVRVQGATVTWSVVSGGGQVSPVTSRTNALGRAKTAWTMGPTPGPVQAMAQVDDLVVRFYAIALAGAPTQVQIVLGDGQSGTRGTILRTQPRVRVVDASGLPVYGVPVRWRIVAGDGRALPDSSQTGYDGLAYTSWAVGMTPGDNAMTATVDGLPAARFTATGLPGQLYLRGGGEVRSEYNENWGLYVDDSVSPSVTDAQGNRAPGATITWTSLRAPLPSRGSWHFRMAFGELPPIATAHYEDQQVHYYVPFEHWWSIRMVPPSGLGPYPASQPLPLQVYVVHEEYDLWFSNWTMVPGVVIDLYDDNGWTARVTSSFDRVEWPLGSKSGRRTLNACVTMEYSDEPICFWQWVDVVP